MPRWTPRTEPPAGRPGRTIQRAAESSGDGIAAKIRAFAKKAAIIRALAAPTGDQADLDADVSERIAGGSRTTAIVVKRKDGSKVYFGKTGTSVKPEYADSVVLQTFDGKDQGLHAEMIMLSDALKNGYADKIEAVGVKGKPCCRLCAGVLSSLGIKYTKAARSNYEFMWKDPYGLAGKDPGKWDPTVQPSWNIESIQMYKSGYDSELKAAVAALEQALA